MRNKKGILIGGLVFVLLCPEWTLAARDLGAAAQSAVSTAMIVAKAASLLGILCGAIAYQIPWAAMFARGTLIGGLLGAALTFLGPSIIALFQSIFGG